MQLVSDRPVAIKKPPDRMEEKELVAGCRGGDPAALRRLAERYYDSIYRVARTLTRDPGGAEDLTQDAFTAAFRAIGAFRGDSGLFTWLVSILRNTWLSRHRKQKRISYLPEIDSGAAPRDDFARADAAADLRYAFGELDEDDRLVLELYHYEGMKYRDMARVMEVTVGTVKSRLFHARQRLKTLLEGTHAV